MSVSYQVRLLLSVARSNTLFSLPPWRPSCKIFDQVRLPAASVPSGQIFLSEFLLCIPHLMRFSPHFSPWLDTHRWRCWQVPGLGNMWGVRLWALNYIKLVIVSKVVSLCYSPKLLHFLGNYNFPQHLSYTCTGHNSWPCSLVVSQLMVMVTVVPWLYLLT